VAAAVPEEAVPALMAEAEEAEAVVETGVLPPAGEVAGNNILQRKE
jgi:hypothetical protein